MSAAIWEFLTLLVQQYGIIVLLIVGLAGLVAYLLRELKGSRAENKALQDQLLALAEKRLEDAKEEREDYEDLAKNLDKSINLLITVFSKLKNDGQG